MSFESVFEPGFAERLKANPRAELEKLGITPTDDLLAEIDRFEVAELEKMMGLLKAGAEGAQPQPLAWP